MLKKLRIKFVLINMSIVTIMLGMIFVVLYYATSSSMERESLQMMQTVSLNPQKQGPPASPESNVNLPYFSILVNRAGEMVSAEGGFFDLSDEDLLNTLMQKTNSAHGESGILEEYSLRYLKTDTPMGRVIVFSDITSEKSTLSHLIRSFLIIGAITFLLFLGISILFARWAVKPVEKAWKQQKQFVADASHELKTPLTVIMTDADLLSSPRCTEEDRLALSSGILSMSGQMRGLVESLLKLARLDNREQKAEVQRFSFSEVAENSSMLFEPLLFEKGFSFSYKIEPGLSLEGNPDQIKQLVEILLDNAGKYASPGGEITLRLKRAGHRQCLLEVSNQGAPISPEDLPRLFERFYRADSARAMNQSYGLGLAIAKSTAENHHGKIWAVSRNGFNCFLAELPLAE